MDKPERSGSQTLLLSVLLSSPGPLVVGIGLLVGRSSTQLADFIRRSAELVAIIVSYLVYRALNKSGVPVDLSRRQSLEHLANLCVGVAMCLSALVMLAVALLSRSAASGNVLFGLGIALLGVTTNTWFWLRYRRLNSLQANSILEVQSRLYRAKTLVDSCVLVALLAVAAWPGTAVARYMDTGGSIVVALYLAASGVKVLRGQKGRGDFVHFSVNS